MSEIHYLAGLSDIAKVSAIENEFLKHEQVEIETKHHFADNVYAREIFIPKGTMLTGHIHKLSQVNVVSKGDISVLMEDGIVKRVVAPAVVVSPAGIKRIGYAHEDTVWITMIGTDKTDIESIEKEFLACSEEEYLLHCNKQIKLTPQ